jgi:hypothetical protein
MKFTLAGVALLGVMGTLSAQDQPPAQKSPGTQQETTITGCLNGGGGQYTLTDQSTGTPMAVTGPAELEKHSTNHTVRLTGTPANEGGRQVFKVSKIEHIAETCSPAGGKNK